MNRHRRSPLLALAGFLLAGSALAQSAEPAAPVSAPPPSNNLGWVMAANLVIWLGIALYVFLLHRKAASLERGE